MMMLFILFVLQHGKKSATLSFDDVIRGTLLVGFVKAALCCWWWLESRPVIFFILLHTSWMLCWSSLSSFCLYNILHLLSPTFSSRWILFNLSLSPDLKTLLLIEEDFQVTSDPGLVVWKAAYSPDWDVGLLTEVYLICDVVDVVLMKITEHIPVSGVKPVLSNLAGLLTPPPHRPGGSRPFLNCRHILRC